MPFDPNNPPDKIRKLSPKKQRQWVEVFNSCWKKYKDDKKCHMMAWGVVKKAALEDRQTQEREVRIASRLVAKWAIKHPWS